MQNYGKITGGIFLLIAVLHGLRVVYAWPAMIGGWIVPIWVSWLAVVIGAILAWHGLKSR